MSHSDRCNWLLEKVDLLIAAEEYDQVLTCLDELIGLEPENAPACHKRAFAHQMLDMPEKSIADMSMAIQHDPDEASYHWARGALITYVTSIDSQISDETRRRQLELAEWDYRRSLSLDPSCPQVWLDLMELSITNDEHDNAVALYGSCRPYIQKRKHLLIRSWLGCIAIVFCSETPCREDDAPLRDHRIRLIKTDWRPTEISEFLQQQKFTKKSVAQTEVALSLHRLFLSHYDETPW